MSNLFVRSKTKEEVTEAVNKAVNGAEARSLAHQVAAHKDDVAAEKMPSLMSSIADSLKPDEAPKTPAVSDAEVLGPTVSAHNFEMEAPSGPNIDV